MDHVALDLCSWILKLLSNRLFFRFEWTADLQLAAFKPPPPPVSPTPTMLIRRHSVLLFCLLCYRHRYTAATIDATVSEAVEQWNPPPPHKHCFYRIHPVSRGITLNLSLQDFSDFYLWLLMPKMPYFVAAFVAQLPSFSSSAATTHGTNLILA